MIRPDGFIGAAFGSALDGDGRKDRDARASISRDLDISDEWAWVQQIHGGDVLRVSRPGMQGPGDGLVTSASMLPLSVATADCYPVILEGAGAVGIAHAGWRGAAAGVVASTRAVMAESSTPAERVAIGPGIRACCFEVGPEVTEVFDERHRSTTTWGTPSVDLVAVIRDSLDGLDVWDSGICTMCTSGYRSFRRDGTDLRQVGIAWVPRV